ncbi:MAG: NUDIX domain-containing protein [Candidatus Acidiferrales bacterium]
MPKKSAGLLMYRIRGERLEMLLVHPGGPYWVHKDVGAWFIPKGEVAPGEDDSAAAIREFTEETGLTPRGPFVMLGAIRHKSGKMVTAWAFEGDCDPAVLTSNTFSMEWPPHSGKQRDFPEIDRAAFFTLKAAKQKMHRAEFEFVSRLASVLLNGATRSPERERASETT